MSQSLQKIRYYIFLRDVLWLAVTAFGGPQAHIAMFLAMLVRKRAYITEEQLIELNALCQILPGPTSTQTIIAIGYKRGGVLLASLTLLVWMLPAVTFMTAFAISIAYLHKEGIILKFNKYFEAMAVGFVTFAAFKIVQTVIKTKTSFFLMLAAAILSYYIRTPWFLPIILVCGGVISSFKFKRQEKAEKEKFTIRWRYLFFYAGIFILSAVLGGITHSLPIRLFENFYRNGSLIFGGGQVLVPVLYTEFVEFKKYLTSEEFMSGYAMVQVLPGPVFSFSAYIGALSMRNFGIIGQICGGFMAALGIFLPGMLLTFFIIHFWEQLKKYRAIRASLEGINGASAGLVITAAILLSQPVEFTTMNSIVVMLTLLALFSEKVPTPFIIIGGMIIGGLF